MAQLKDTIIHGSLEADSLAIGGNISHSGQSITREYNGGQVIENRKRSDFDSRMGVVPTETQYLTTTYVKDKNDENAAWDQTYLYTSGKMWRSIGVGRCDSNGENRVSNSIMLGIGADGSKEVSLSNPDAWRDEIGAAAASHNHSADNITSGTLALARGGTGATSANGARDTLLGGMTARVSSQQIVTTSVSKVTCGTKLYGHGSNLQLSSGGIKCLQAGTVLVSICARASYVDSLAYIEGHVYKNSSNITTFYGFNSATGEWFGGFGGCILVTVAANDIIYFYAKTNSGECTLLADKNNTLTVAYI